MALHICPECQNVEKLITPILAYCQHCDQVRQISNPNPAPLPPRQELTQQAPILHEIDQDGPELLCEQCGCVQTHVSPILALCRSCGTIRSLVPKPAVDPAKQDAIRREIIVVRNALRARGLPRIEHERFRERLKELESQCS